MTDVLKNPMEDTFLELCASSKQSIKLCAPFIKETIIQKITGNKKQNTNINLITNINLNGFYKKTSDISALTKFLNYSDFIYNRSNLHAKIYIFDDSRAIITSGNLTHNGLTYNYEYGILTDDEYLLKQVVSDYMFICNDDITGKVRQQQLDEIETILATIPKSTIQIPSIKNILSSDKDDVIDVNPMILANRLLGWKKVVFEIINNLPDDIFTNDDFIRFYPDLKNQYPNNYNIPHKIRQQLQELRDIGLIEFTSRGKYRRLWIADNRICLFHNTTT